MVLGIKSIPCPPVKCLCTRRKFSSAMAPGKLHQATHWVSAPLYGCVTHAMSCIAGVSGWGENAVYVQLKANSC